jgi:dethiobiotin synthetase
VNRTLFITGTDTGVGKTLIACGIAAYMRRQGIDVGVMKPIETGFSKRSPSRDAARLRRYAQSSDSIDMVGPFTYKEAVSPWIAARHSGRPVQIRRILQTADVLMRRHDVLLMEGAGGLLVPLTQNLTMLDLIKRLKTPVLLVTSDRVGTLNHTLLSVNELRAAKIIVLGIIVNGTDVPTPAIARRSTAWVLKKLSRVPVWGTIPRMKKSTVDRPASLADAVSRVVPIERLEYLLTHARESPGTSRHR